MPYESESSGFNEGILTPRNLGEAIKEALGKLRTTLGTSLDAFVQEQLNYPSRKALHDALMGLQVDAVAAAIYNIQRGKAAIIADQTGVGKGRQAAALLRYALEHDLTPVFITVDPALYTDMWRDLTDIGETRLKPLIFNEGKGIEIENALGEKETLFRRRGSARRKALEGLERNGHLPEDANGVFVTYPQLNRLGNRQQRALTNLADNALLIMDESHKAAGDSNTGLFFRNLVEQAKGTVFLSATWAKRPDNVPLYGVTALSEAVNNLSDLPEIMQTGGLPLQTIVSNMLAREGQLFRRERSFKGIEFKTRLMGQDNGVENAVEKARQVQIADQATKVLRAVVHANQAFLNLDFDRIKKQVIRERGGSATSAGNNQVSMNVTAGLFTSTAHNYINQLLYGVKLDVAVKDAVAAHRRGEKVLIVVDQTFGSFHDEFVTARGLSHGQRVEDFGYHHMLHRMSVRSRRITITDRRGQPEHVIPALSELSRPTQELYQEVDELIAEGRAITDQLSGSPIDYLLYELKKAGLVMGEITGRKHLFHHSEDGITLEARTDTNKTDIVRRFNGGQLDGLILNRSGSTGLSMHASEKFTDQKPRHMIVLQADQDVNQFMQMLGRINRHGQVKLPLFSLLQLSLPAEKRVAAMLSRKMQSLNANTSSDTESDSSLKNVVDMLNKYGDEIVRDFLLTRPDVQTDTGYRVQAESIPADLAKKFFNRLSLMPVAYQEQVYDEVEPVYEEYIAFLDKTHQNELKPKVLDLDARLVERTPLAEGRPGTSVFARPVMQEKLNIKRLGKPPRYDEVLNAVEQAQQDKSGEVQLRELVATMESDTGFIDTLNRKIDQLTREAANTENLSEKRRDEIGAELRKLREQASQYERTKSELTNTWLPQMMVGAWTRIRLEGVPTVAVVTEVKYRHEPGKGNPFSPSKVSVKFMVNDPVRQVQLPLSKLLSGQPGDRLFMEQMSAHEIRPEQLFTGENQGGNREDRYMITENLLQGVMETEKRGQVVNYTTDQGTVKQGYLLPRNFDPATDVKDTIALPVIDTVMKYLAKAREVGGDAQRLGLRTRRKNTYVAINTNGSVELVAPRPKRSGQDIWGNEALLAITGDFVSRGDTLRVTVPEEKAEAALSVFMKLEPLFIPRTQKPVLDAALGNPPSSDSEVRFSRTTGPTNQSRGKVRGGMKARRVKQSVAEIGRGIKPRVRVVQSDTELPESVLKKAGEHSQGADNIKAVYDPDTGKNGTLWLVADHLSDPAEARRKLIHEITHYGLRRLLKDPGRLRRTLRQIGRDIPEGDLQRIAQAYELNLDKREDYLEAVEEVLAHYAETAPEAGWFRRAVARLRRWLRGVFPGLRWSRNDVHALLMEARRAAQEPVKQTGREPVRMGYLKEHNTPLPRDHYADVFHSALLHALDRVPMEKGTGEQFLNFLIKMPGVRKEEMDWIGLTEYLERRAKRKVRLEEILKYVAVNQVKLEEQIKEYPSTRKNQRVNQNRRQVIEWMGVAADYIEEVNKGAEGATTGATTAATGQEWRKAMTLMQEYWDGLMSLSDIDQEEGDYRARPRSQAIAQEILALQGDNPMYTVESLHQFWRRYSGLTFDFFDMTRPKYGNNLSATEDPETSEDQNYREFILAMPIVSVDMGRRGRMEDMKKLPPFTGDHFGVENNIVHVLAKDRTTLDGQTMLHIEELQSDWHQKASKSRYSVSKEEHRRELRQQRASGLQAGRAQKRLKRANKALIKAVEEGASDKTVEQLREKMHEAQETVHRLNALHKPAPRLNRDPDAILVPPFKKSWRLLAFKRLLRFAAENGYDGITWPSGDQVGMKYNKVKVFSRLEFDSYGIMFPSNSYNIRYSTDVNGSKYYENHPADRDKLFELLEQTGDPEAIELKEAIEALEAEFENDPDDTAKRSLTYQKDRYTNRLKEILENPVDLDSPIINRDRNRFFDMLYNRQLPSEFQKYVKKYGGKVETLTIMHPKGEPVGQSKDTRFVKGIKITPALKELALHKGQAMFARGNPNVSLNPNAPALDAKKDISLLDRTFRLPFRVLGGVDGQNRWKLGHEGINKVMNRMGGWLEKAGDAPKGSFKRNIHTLAQTVSYGVVDRRESPQWLLERDFAREGERRTWLRNGMRMIDTMIQGGANSLEGRVLYDMITGQVPVNDPRLNQLAEPVREAMREMGQLAVEYGLITQESYERYEGAYLHRSYLRHEHFDQSKAQQWVSQWLNKRRKRLLGDTLKGRGVFEPRTVERLLKHINEHQPGWYEAQVRANNPLLKQERFRVLDRHRSDGRVMKRVFWPEGVDVPTEYEGYTDTGIMEVRAVRQRRGQTELILWRDYTLEERQRMGEIMDARYAVARTYHTMASDLANGHFYKDIADHPEASMAEPKRKEMPPEWWAGVIDPPRRWDTLALVNAEWVRVPQTRLPKSGTPVWGTLAGRLVKPEVWRDLNELNEMQRPTTWRTLLKEWKKNKTTRSLKTHANNVMSNVILMDLMDVRFRELYEAVKEYGKGELWQEAEDMGVFGVDMAEQELREGYLKPLLKAIREQNLHTVQQPLEQTTRMLSLMARVGEQLKTVDDGLTRLYQLEDDIFRLATYIRRKRLGDTKAQAAMVARDQFVNYDIRAPWVNMARQTLLPFISYSYRMVPLLANAMRARPWKLAKYFTLSYMMIQAAYWIDGGDEEEEDRALPEGLQGWTLLGIPKAFRLPGRDYYGDPLFADMSRKVPGSDLVEMNSGRSAIPIPEWLMWGGPLMTALEVMTNTASYTGKPIVDEHTDTLDEKTVKVLGHVYRSWMPSGPYVPWSTDAIRAGRASEDPETGRTGTSVTGKPYDALTEIYNGLGWKVRGQNTRDNQFIQELINQRSEREIRQAMKDAERQLLRGDMTKADVRQRVERLQQHLDRLEEKRRKQRGEK